MEQRDEGFHQRSVSFRTPPPFVGGPIVNELSSEIVFQSYPRPRHTAYPKGDVGTPMDSQNYENRSADGQMDCAGVGVVLPRGSQIDIKRRVSFLIVVDAPCAGTRVQERGKKLTDALFGRPSRPGSSRRDPPTTTSPEFESPAPVST